MAEEVARRRELRRRKILENSEDRLRKLTTVDRTRPKDGNDRSQTSSPVNREVIYKDSTLHALNQINQRDQNKNRYNFQNDTTDEDEDDNYMQSARLEQHGQSGNIQNLPKILSENKICSKAKFYSNRGACKQSVSLQPLDFIQRRKWFCVLLAFLGRILGYLSGSFALNKGFNLVFIAMEIGVFGKEVMAEGDHRSPPNGILVAALLLCGIRNATRIVQLFDICIKVIEDFAIFFFTFFVCHWWIEEVR